MHAHQTGWCLHLISNRSLVNYLAAAVYTIFLLIVSIAPKEQLPPMADVPLADKWAHLVAYAIFAWLLYRCAKTLGYSDNRSFISVLLVAASFGVLMEWAQYSLAVGRYFEVWDMVANTLGATLALLLIRVIRFY